MLIVTMQKKIVSVGNMDMDINRLFFSFSLTPPFTLYPVLSLFKWGNIYTNRSMHSRRRGLRRMRSQYK